MGGSLSLARKGWWLGNENTPDRGKLDVIPEAEYKEQKCIEAPEQSALAKGGTSDPEGAQKVRKRGRSPAGEPIRLKEESVVQDCRATPAIQAASTSTPKDALASISTVKQEVTRSQVFAWLQSAITGQQLDLDLQALDDTIVDFVVSENREGLLPALAPRLRWWVHTRATSLGLQSASGLALAREREKAMTLTKPAGWYFDGERKAEHMQVHVKNPQKKAKRARMEAWRTGCEECGTELDAYHAWYHWNGLGPMCQACVESDAELREIKWELKCDFWY